MFCLNDNMRYFLCDGHTDMRKRIFGLNGLVHDKMGGDVRSGDVYQFYVGNKIMLVLTYNILK